MLRIETIRQIRGLLLSERITYKGNEFLSLGQIMGELNAEEAEAIRATRVKAAPTPPPEKTDEHD